MSTLGIELPDSNEYPPDFVDVNPLLYSMWHTARHALKKPRLGSVYSGPVLPGVLQEWDTEDSRRPERFSLCAPFMGIDGNHARTGVRDLLEFTEGEIGTGLWVRPAPADDVSSTSYLAGSTLFLAPFQDYQGGFPSLLINLRRALRSRSTHEGFSYEMGSPCWTINIPGWVPMGCSYYPNWCRAPILPPGTEVLAPKDLVKEHLSLMESFPGYPVHITRQCIGAMESLPEGIGEVVESGFDINRMTQLSRVVWPGGVEKLLDSRVLDWKEARLGQAVPITSIQAPLREEALTNPELF